MLRVQLNISLFFSLLYGGGKQRAKYAETLLERYLCCCWNDYDTLITSASWVMWGRTHCAMNIHHIFAILLTSHLEGWSVCSLYSKKKGKFGGNRQLHTRWINRTRCFRGRGNCLQVFPTPTRRSRVRLIVWLIKPSASVHASSSLTPTGPPPLRSPPRWWSVMMGANDVCLPSSSPDFCQRHPPAQAASRSLSWSNCCDDSVESPPRGPFHFFFIPCGKELKMLAVVNMQMSSLNRTHTLFPFFFCSVCLPRAPHAINGSRDCELLLASHLLARWGGGRRGGKESRSPNPPAFRPLLLLHHYERKERKRGEKKPQCRDGLGRPNACSR